MRIPNPLARWTSQNQSDEFSYKDDPGYQGATYTQRDDLQAVYRTLYPQTAVSIWSQAAKEPRWEVSNGLDPEGLPNPLDPDQQLVADLLVRPNPRQTWRQFIGRVVASTRVIGQTFVVKAQPEGGSTVALWHVSAFNMQWNSRLGMYERSDVSPSAAEDVAQDKKRLYAPSEVIEFQFIPSEGGPNASESPLAAAAAHFALQGDTIERARKTARQWAAGTLLYPEVPREQNLDIDLDLDKLQRAVTNLRSDIDNGSVAYVPLKIGSQQLSYPLSSLVTEWVEQAPAAAAGAMFGIPPILMFSALGLQSGTYANASQFRRDFAQRSVVPHLEDIADTLTMFLLREFSATGVIQFRRDDISALWEGELEQAQRLEIYSRNGWFTLDRTLRELDEEPLPNGQGDIRQVPAGLLWVPTDDLVGGGDALGGDGDAPDTTPAAIPASPPAASRNGAVMNGNGARR